MAYIEDYIKEFCLGRIRTGLYDQSISHSLGLQVLSGNPLTEKQANLSLRLLGKYKQQFLNNGFSNIVEDLSSPVFKYPFRKVEQTKAATISNGKIVIKFPFNQALVNSMREIANASYFCKPVFDGDTKSWIMDLNEESLAFVDNKLLPDGFDISLDIQEYIDQISKIKDEIDQHIPMLVKNGDQYLLKNSVVTGEYIDIVDAVVDATQKGIYVHDDEVNQELMALTTTLPIMKLFTIGQAQKILVNSDEYSKQQLLWAIKQFNGPVAIFFEESVTPNDLKDWVTELNELGVSNDEIAVYFRKSSTTDMGFNQTVKDLNLNKDADDKNVKWMFLSSKYPKSLFKHNKVADICIFADRQVSTHYTVINVSKNAVLSIRYADKKFAELENAYNTKRGEKIVVL
jgi:hypothetical protein